MGSETTAFVSPMWTPARADLLEKLCGEVGDEDRSLSDRAEDRAERFEDYSDKRTSDAEAARQAVSAIADNSPFGQPILVGHHSERHARKDAQRIENGMRKAVKMWETAEYWKQRAANAIQHAKYKELPSVRARRIKSLEADKRKQDRVKAEAEKWLRLWTGEALTIETARRLANVCHMTVCRDAAAPYGWTAWDVLRPDEERYSSCPGWTVEQVQDVARKSYPRQIEHAARWIAHIDNRLAYERAMLGDAGGLASDRKTLEKGGAVQCWASPRGGWSYVQKVNKVSVTVLDNWGNGGANFRRNISFDKLTAIMTAADVQTARDAGQIIETENGKGFYLKDAPAPESNSQKNERLHREHLATRAPTPAAAADFDTIKEQLKRGVQVIVAEELFPTPADLAARMVDLAEIEEGHRVLEPSAGMGAILDAIHADAPAADVLAVEINPALAKALESEGLANASASAPRVLQADFLECDDSLGRFDRIVMNPPFGGAADIKHIEHAATMLAPGGRLVAICANGPRQQQRLRPRCAEWCELPADTFKAAGTSVRTVLLVIEANARH